MVHCKSFLQLLLFVASLILTKGRNLSRFSFPKNRQQLFKLGRKFQPHVLNSVAVAETIHQVARWGRTDPTTVIMQSNFAIYGAAVLASLNHRTAAWMIKHMVCSYDKRLRSKLPHTYLTSAFMHASIDHLLSNMGALNLFGRRLVGVLGSRRFLYLYVASTYAGHLLDETLNGVSPIEQEARDFLTETYKNKTGSNVTTVEATGTVGASGAISGLISYFCLRFPQSRVSVLLAHEWVFKGTAFQLGLWWFITELLGALAWRNRSGIAHLAHVGGSLLGGVVFGVETLLRLLSEQKPKRIV